MEVEKGHLFLMLSATITLNRVKEETAKNKNNQFMQTKTLDFPNLKY